MTVPATLRRISTGEILKRGILPNSPDISPVGLDPDLEWLIDYTPYAMPDYDPRVFQLVTEFAPTQTAHPLYPLYNQYLITYRTEKREADYVKSQAEAKERERLEVNVDYTQRDKLVLLGLAVLFRSLDGLELNAKETVIRNRVMTAAVNLWKNDARVQELKAQIDAGQEIDLDEGWN